MRADTFLEGLHEAGHLTAAELEHLRTQPREVVIEAVLERFDTAAESLQIEPLRQAQEIEKRIPPDVLKRRVRDEPELFEVLAQLKLRSVLTEPMIEAKREVLRHQLEALEFGDRPDLDEKLDRMRRWRP